MLHKIIVTILVLFLITGSLVNAKQSDDSTNKNQITYKNEKPILFENDGLSIEAFEGSIEVLENRNNPTSRSIPLHYVRFPATANKNGSPIIYLSGGPGGSGISTAKVPGFRFPLFMAMREFGDVIALDQRGTGKSKIVPDCVSQQILPLMKVITDDEVKSLYRSAAKECVDFWQKHEVDVLGYTSVQSAHDLNDLRKHFGAKKITLWGISYGSHLALTSLKELKGFIDKVVIASAEGLNQTVKLPAQTDAYFERLQQAINLEPKAAEAFPDIKTLISRVNQKLEKSPIAIKIPLKDKSELDFLFQKSHMQIIASGMIADPHRMVGILLNIYKAIDHGNTDVLIQVLSRGYFNDNRISFDVMSFGMDVASGVTADRLKLVEEQAKTGLLGSMLNFPMPQLDKAIEGLDLGDAFRANPKSDVPTLLFTGTLDGRTYPESQKEAVEGLTNLTQVTVVNGGHNLFMLSPKVTEVIQQFMKDEEITISEIAFKLPPFVK